ncbi:HAD-superfamily hydrolase [Lactococcus piscium]|uniref:HAD-superfamily hydrolase n=1 Tax=Pseudolactococcus piscium TaxID=1364 RepID=A0A2A5RZ60_9LACT|nr:HAD-superfamily hydrolase [Lactococcus piscium]
MLDTEHTYRDGWLDAFEKMGIDKNAYDLAAWSGMSWLQTRKLLAADLGDAMVSDIRQARETYILSQMTADKIPIKSGAHAVLQVAKKKGLKLAVVSSTVSSRAIPLLENADLLTYFDVHVFGDEVMAHKPLPDPYLAALAKLGVEASQALAVEDSFTGALSATKAGLSVFLVPDKSFNAKFSDAALAQLTLFGVGNDLYELVDKL